MHHRVREGWECTPLTEMNFWRSGCLMPLRCALRFWLWLVWFFDLAIVCSTNRPAHESGAIQNKSALVACKATKGPCPARANAGNAASFEKKRGAHERLSQSQQTR